MRILLLVAISILHGFAASATAQSLKGTFIAAVDDHVTLFLNGSKVFHGDKGTSRSVELALKVGDRLAVHLVNDEYAKRFLLVFASTDNKQIVSFRANDFRIVPTVGVTYFFPEQFAKWNKPATKFKGNKGLDKLVKNYSDWVWGDLDKCIIACIITPQMVTPRPN